MKRTLMRRQVLKLVAGMALSPWPLHAASTQTVSVQQTAAALLAATEEGSLLQIDLEDLCHTLKLCGSSPVSFTVTDHDVDKVLGACRNALARMPSHKVKAAVLVCRVESTMCPVCAALIAISAVSRSRISPTMMMSGSWRKKALSAMGKVSP